MDIIDILNKVENQKLKCRSFYDIIMLQFLD